MKPLTTITDPRLVKALAHPMRLQILSVLEQRTASPKQIAEEIDQPLTHVSYHVRQLQQFGVIRLVSTRQVRGAIEHHYRMDARPSISDEAWREAPEIAKQALIGAVLGQVSTQVNAASAQGGFSRDGAHLSRLPLELDERGWREVSKAFERLTEKLERIQEDSNARVRESHAERASALAVLMLFEAAAQKAENGSGKARRGRPRERSHTS